MKKGFVNFLEMVVVILVLFVAFGVFFPGFYYQGRWVDTQLLIKNRDLVLSSDRIGQLYNYSFNSTNLQTYMDDMLGKESGMIAWTNTEGAVKSTLLVACNCTDDGINNLISWFKDLKINERNIDVLPCYTNLEKINPCLSSSDVLLIIGNKSLSSPTYLKTLRDYLKSGSGIVEMADLTPSFVRSDTVQQTIFGLDAEANPVQGGLSEYDYFRDLVNSPTKRPLSATAISYLPWKYFYHVSLPLPAYLISSGYPPTDPRLSPPYCSEMSTGSFKLQLNVTDLGGGNIITSPNLYRFWICNSTKVYFDSDLNNSADVGLGIGDNLVLSDYYNNSFFWNFTLNYIEGQQRIRMSFKPDYRFSDFSTYHGECACPPNKPGKCPKSETPSGMCQGSKSWAIPNINLILPGDGNLNRILIQANNRTVAGNPIPVVILNATSGSRVAWIANFSAGGVGDDEKLLFLSLMLWASNKRTQEMSTTELKLGLRTSYVDVYNKDMFEVYKLDFGLGYPF